MLHLRFRPGFTFGSAGALDCRSDFGGIQRVGICRTFWQWRNEAESLAPSLVGAVVKDPTIAFQEYLESVVRTRDGWSDLYAAIREGHLFKMPSGTDERVHILGIRHHGPGSAALLCKALDTLDPGCVLVEGPPEG